MADKKRLKDRSGDELAAYNSLKPELRAFVDEYEALSGDRFYITSGKRTAGENDRFSHHHEGNALDLRTVNTYNEEGESNGDGDAGIRAYIFLYNTPDGLNLMKKYNLGLIDETDPHTLKKTGGTGNHIHIGKDSHYAKHIDERLNTFGTEHFRVILPYQSVFKDGQKVVEEGYVQNMALNKGFDYSPDSNVQAHYDIANADFSDIDLGGNSLETVDSEQNYPTYKEPNEVEPFDYEEMARTVLALQREQEEPQRQALAIKEAEEQKQKALEQRLSTVMSMFEEKQTTPAEELVAKRRERQGGYEEQQLPFFEQEINPYLGQINIDNG